jgi:PPOX class probable F420-dependent enzyme
MAVVLRFAISTSRFIRTARVAHLATADAAGEPLVVPICFVFDGKHFFTPIDEKPKRVAPANLRRVKNIKENPRVCLVIDRYDENWRKLCHILIAGKARIVLRGSYHQKAIALLRRKYPQYRAMSLDRRPVIMIAPRRTVSWGNL